MLTEIPTVGDQRRLGPLLLTGGAVGGAAAFALVLEKIATLREPSHVPSCDLNPVMSCGPVMSTAQAELFGFPNPLLGLVGFTVVVVPSAVLLGGARLPRWSWPGLQGGWTFGTGFELGRAWLRDVVCKDVSCRVVLGY